MRLPRKYVALALCLALATCVAQKKEQPADSAERRVLDAAVSLEGVLRLDVTVTDHDGRLVSDLQRGDFSLFDNGRPQKIVAFRRSDSPYPPVEPPPSILLFLDTLELPPEMVRFEREQTAMFLRRHEGRLAQAVTIYSLTSQGLSLLAGPSRDGIALASAVEAGAKVKVLFGLSGSGAPKTPNGRPYSAPLTAIRALGVLGEIQSTLPGHKLLLWVGPGYRPFGSGAYMDLDVHNSPTQSSQYEKLRWLSACLRQARIVIDTFSVEEDDAAKAKDTWKALLDVSPSPPNLGIMNIYKKTLAVGSGGRVLWADGDLAGQMESALIRQARITC